MKKQYFLLASLALGMAACTNDTLTPDEIVDEENNGQEEVVSTLQHAKLNSFNSSQNRVTVFPQTRADESGPLKLIAEIDNLSKEENNSLGFVREPDGRYLSATCVFYDAKTGTYYVTYHMQGNNYNTQQKNETLGFIETFTINEDGEPVVGKIYAAANPSELSFDFNQLYFDNIEQHGTQGNVTEDRIIVVGHLSEPTSTNKIQTKAIIGKFTPEDNYLDYEIVYTGNKIVDADGKSLGKEDAQDVNCVVRRYNTYYLATRKGIALLNGRNEYLFKPMKDHVGNDYFIPTPGSVKHVAFDGGYSKVSFLYLTEDFPENFQYSDAIDAKVVKFDIHNVMNDRNDLQSHVGYLGLGNTWDTLLSDVKNNNFLDYVQSDSWNIDIPNVSPIDGKNVLYMLPGSESQYYAAAGKAGLYFRNDNHGQFGQSNEGHLEFGNRPVNGVFVDEGHSSEHHNGFIYVVNGSKLTIFNRYKLDEVASWNLPNTADGSANYVVARLADEPNEDGNYDRIITVAFGQEGVKIFRFTPKSLWS